MSETLNLTKGQTVDLNKEAGAVLTDITVGLGWDMAKIGAIDLDASAIAYDKDGNKLGHVFFNEKSAFGGALKLSGDNLTGQGDGDDESIYLKLADLPANVASVLITVTNYSQQPLEVVKNAFARIYDTASKVELARYTLSEFGKNTAVYFVNVKRGATGWEVKALGEAANGKTFADLANAKAKELVTA